MMDKYDRRQAEIDIPAFLKAMNVADRCTDVTKLAAVRLPSSCQTEPVVYVLGSGWVAVVSFRGGWHMVCGFVTPDGNQYRLLPHPDLGTSEFYDWRTTYSDVIRWKPTTDIWWNCGYFLKPKTPDDYDQ